VKDLEKKIFFWSIFSIVKSNFSPFRFNGED